MFFDEHDRFLDTSAVYARPDRLNLRHQAIFAEHPEIYRGARVLDIASHDGRWSFAAIKAGATHVTGVEARRPGVRAARESFAHYGVPSEQYRFRKADIFRALERQEFQVDVVLCLGFLYHTFRHTELMSRIRDLNPTWLVVDSTVYQSEEPVFKLRTDRPKSPGHAAEDPFGYAGRTMVARPSAPAIREMLDLYDFDLQAETDWEKLLSDHPDAEGMGDYRTGARVTMFARSR